MQPYIGEIRIFAGTYAPAGWAFCDGAPQAISENDALFVVLGTTYGGDGEETFNLPDLRGRLPMHQGTVDGNTFTIGEAGGTEEVTLTTQQIPAHNHPMLGSTSVANDANPENKVVSEASTFFPYLNAPPSAPMAATSITGVGGSQPHNNMQPYLCLNFIIALYGLFPNQN